MYEQGLSCSFCYAGNAFGTYANVHKGIIMIAQWRWRQAFIPQLVGQGEYINSTDGGTVEITSVTDTSDENYNAAYNENGGKSYHAAIDERITVNAVANSGYTFEGWYDESGKLITTNEEYAFVEAKESVKTFYARFSNTITQTYIRQVKDGDGWKDTTDDTIGTLDRYTYTDAVGSAPPPLQEQNINLWAGMTLRVIRSRRVCL